MPGGRIRALFHLHLACKTSSNLRYFSILLAAASVGESLRAEVGDFQDAVGRAFEKRIESELGEQALKCAELVSVLTHVGVSGKFEAELKVICEIFGDGWQPPRVLSTLEDLEEAGLARRGGSLVSSCFN